MKDSKELLSCATKSHREFMKPVRLPAVSPAGTEQERSQPQTWAPSAAIKREILATTLIILLAFSCTSIEIKKEEVPGDVIVEGRGVGGIWLGDTFEHVSSILGKPQSIKTNEAKTSLDFIKIYIIKHEGFTAIAADIFENAELKQIFLHPFYRYYCEYFEEGLILYFDDQERLVSLIVIAHPFRGYSAPERSLYYGKVNFRDGFGHAEPEYARLEKEKGWGVSASIYRKTIEIHTLDTTLFFSSNGQNLEFVTIISPIVGGADAPVFFAHQENFPEKRLEELREKYGSTYMRK